ncbi:dienelactone hydrolase family protein [Mucilaginibacter gossypii]|uniref:dienelactone hydrolase family protein n=1 Tax=Mucilaginibacter gossypii TaxID=551996 RepID=UPI000DCED63A|nr:MULTISPECIES: alpha/beta hydrolase [Mucilaginibacter]QTE34880.1 dienelactone hydrolase family protein [Mucilaginibacter gossypii]RAV59606.1 alpha/beta hydrolase [Mucilaginibacter rubeus]
MNRYNNQISIPADGIRLAGVLTIPADARAIIVFAHGSGSSRLSPRNMQVTGYLQAHHFGTLLFDLLTPEEDEHYRNRFAIELLKGRLIAATQWLSQIPAARDCVVAYFGASTGAAAALKAAADLRHVFAVVSRGGRPDMAMQELPYVKAPVLLIVGSEDEQVLSLNRVAYNELGGEKRLEIIPGAGHLFSEPGKLAAVATMAVSWFAQHQPPVASDQPLIDGHV